MGTSAYGRYHTTVKEAGGLSKDRAPLGLKCPPLDGNVCGRSRGRKFP